MAALLTPSPGEASDWIRIEGVNEWHEPTGKWVILAPETTWPTFRPESPWRDLHAQQMLRCREGGPQYGMAFSHDMRILGSRTRIDGERAKLGGWWRDGGRVVWWKAKDLNKVRGKKELSLRFFGPWGNRTRFVLRFDLEGLDEALDKVCDRNAEWAEPKSHDGGATAAFVEALVADW